jgi:DNA-binding response OmpR family regulator
MAAKLLIIEDESRIAQWVRAYGEREGHQCFLAADGQSGLDMFFQLGPDLVILDLMLPKIDGLQVCQAIREHSEVPIIMLTARLAEPDIIQGLKSGADDYVTKPFSPAELMARVEAQLRRQKGKAAAQSRLERGEIVLDILARQCFVRGEGVSLTAHQFDLLAFLMQHPQQVFSRDQLIQRVFGFDYDSDERAIDIHIRRLRTKIEPDPSQPRYIQTVFGAGYRFDP